MNSQGQDLCYTTQFITRSVEETRALGQKIGRNLFGKLVITLCGDLGSGKTVLVQGLARGLEVSEDYYITSPTYTLINEYPGRLRLFHVDLYRMENLREMEDVGLEEILDEDAVIAIEWADKLPMELLTDHIHLTFEITADETRKISIFCYGLQPPSLVKELEKIG